MVPLCELACLIRSKNAGPFELTFDVMFDRVEDYQRAQRSGVFTPERVEQLYRVAASDVGVFFCEHALAIKISFPRPFTQGDIYDGDSHGGQQYAPLMYLEID
jgi:hypothetical protein